ncbi:hypothetical protein C7S15_4139 [Burkholderia cepacia]|nr:hypothetical protein [Burkholderia cepacia]
MVTFVFPEPRTIIFSSELVYRTSSKFRNAKRSFDLYVIELNDRK